MQVVLPRVRPPNIDAQADYMSVGPIGATERDATSGFGMDWRHILRVTICRYEREGALMIDDMMLGRAGQRSVRAEYRYSSWDPDTLWAALNGAPRVLPHGLVAVPIDWLSPTSFKWITYADTLEFEQMRDSLFKVTLRARIH